MSFSQRNILCRLHPPQPQTQPPQNHDAWGWRQEAYESSNAYIPWKITTNSTRHSVWRKKCTIFIKFKSKMIMLLNSKMFSLFSFNSRSSRFYISGVCSICHTHGITLLLPNVNWSTFIHSYFRKCRPKNFFFRIQKEIQL